MLNYIRKGSHSNTVSYRHHIGKLQAGARADEDFSTDDATGNIVDGVHPSWVRVGRILAERRDGGSKSAREVLVKWQGLGYEEASWEEERGLPGPEAQAEIAMYRARRPIMPHANGSSKVRVVGTGSGS